jgi:4-hydroxythreonine-4-phosphate dehydrogenase
MTKKVLAISVGDLNGIGIEIILKAHKEISKIAQPVYCISQSMLEQACNKLHIKRPENMTLFPIKGEFKINPGKVNKKSGKYSYNSFKRAIKLCENKTADALVTLPIHKEAWSKAGIDFKGHTDMLRSYFDKEAIMMLGCDKMYVALYTEHTPLSKVPQQIKTKRITRFLLNLSKDVIADKIAVLGLNPHAGDGGVLGDEEKYISQAINNANKSLEKVLFIGPFVPDTAFTKNMRKQYKHYVAMYHDQGLIPLKALHFDESINISLNLPIIRTSVDHGTAFDIAYKNKSVSQKSYINAVRAAINQAKNN